MITPLPCCPVCMQQVTYVGDKLDGVTTIGDTDVFHCETCKMYIVLGEVDESKLESAPDATGDSRELDAN